MPPIIQIVLTADDRTGPAFTSARANVQSLAAISGQAQQALGSYTTASNSAAAQVAQSAQSQQQSIAAVGVQVGRTAQAQRQATAATNAAARADATLAALQDRLQQSQLRLSLAQTSGAARVAVLAQEHQRLTARTREAGIAQDELTRRQIRATDAATRLQTAQNAQNRGLGPALPRTFAGFTGQGALQAAGAAGLVTSVDQLIGKTAQYADQGQRVQVVLDQTRASLGALMSDQTKANAVFDRAVAVGTRYGFTQQDTAEAIRTSSLLIRESQAPIEEIFTTLAKLQVLSPEQGLSGASLAIKELAAGDIVSLRERFEVSASAANKMKAEIQGGADAVQVLGRYLRSIGIMDGALEANLSGAAGQQRAMAQATEGLGLAINDVVTSSGFREFATGFIQDTTQEITWLKNLGVAIDETAKKMQQDPGVRFLEGIDNFLQGEIDRDIRRIQEWTGQATKARQAAADAYAIQRVPFQPGGASTDVAPSAAMASPRFAGFGNMVARYPESTAPPVQNIVNVTVQGSILSEREVGEIGHRYLVNLDRRNAGDLGFNR